MKRRVLIFTTCALCLLSMISHLEGFGASGVPPPDLSAFERPDLEPSELAAAFEAAEALSTSGQWREAMKGWQACARLWPNAPEPLYNAARCGASLDPKDKDLIQGYQKALNANPCPFLAGFIAHNQGLLLLQAGQMEEGVQRMRDAGKALDGPIDERLVGALLCEQREAWEMAAKLYREAKETWKRGRTRCLPWMSEGDGKKLLEYLACVAESHVKIVQVKLRDTTLVQGKIVGGTFQKQDYGPSPSEKIMQIQTLEGPVVDVDKDKITFSKLISMATDAQTQFTGDPALLREVNIKSMAVPMPIIGQSKLVSLSEDYLSTKRPEEATACAQIAYEIRPDDASASALANAMADSGRGEMAADILTDLAVSLAKKALWVDAEDYTSWALKLAPSHERASRFADLAKPFAEAERRTLAEAQGDAAPPMQGGSVPYLLAAKTWHWQRQPGGILVEGEVQNLTDRPFPVVEVVVNFFDQRGDLIMTRSTHVANLPLPPFRTTFFKLACPPLPVAESARIRFTAGYWGGEIPTRNAARAKGQG